MYTSRDIVRCTYNLRQRNGKKSWLEKFVINVQDIEELGCPSLKKIKRESLFPCTHHTFPMDEINCVAQNVMTLKTWILNPPPPLHQPTLINMSNDIDEVDNVEKVDNSTTLKEFYNQCDFLV